MTLQRCVPSLRTAAVLATWSLTVIAAVWAASADRTTTVSELGGHRRQITDHETRLRSVERHVSEIARDVQWIRRTMEADK